MASKLNYKMALLEELNKSMTEHILYTFRRCPYAIRARMALAYAEIKFELRELLLRDKPADMLKKSPKGTVPVLILKEGRVIDESLDVMLWALEQHDPENWLNDKRYSLALIEEYDKNFKPLLDRYKYADRHPDMSPEQHRELTLPYIESLNKHLSKTKYLVSDQISLADVALFPFVRQYAFVDKNWFDQLSFQNLQKWLKHFLDSKLFQQVMLKYKLFNDGFSYNFQNSEQITQGNASSLSA